MRIYVIGGKFVALVDEEDWEDELTNKWNSALLRFAEFYINEDDERILPWKLVKNRYDGATLNFFSFNDAHEYIVANGGEHIQRHKGLINLETDAKVFEFLKSHSPMWAEGLDEN